MRYVVCICDECSHAWMSAAEMPARCARCKSSTWDGQEKRERGRPRKSNDVQPIAEVQPHREEIIEHAPTERQTPAEEAPIENEHYPAQAPTVIPARHSPPEKSERKWTPRIGDAKKAKRIMEAKARPGKLKVCAHNFYVLDDGTTNCPTCKIGA